MLWVKDCDDVLVNIANWDTIDWYTIVDTDSGDSVFFAIYLERSLQERILGYVSCDGNCAEAVLEQVSKGVAVYFSTLESLIYIYLGCRKELNEAPADEGQDDEYDRDRAYAKSLIGKRFKPYGDCEDA